MAVRELLGREVDTAALCDEDTDLGLEYTLTRMIGGAKR